MVFLWVSDRAVFCQVCYSLHLYGCWMFNLLTKTEVCHICVVWCNVKHNGNIAKTLIDCIHRVLFIGSQLKLRPWFVISNSQKTETDIYWRQNKDTRQQIKHKCILTWGIELNQYIFCLVQCNRVKVWGIQIYYISLKYGLTGSGA